MAEPRLALAREISGVEATSFDADAQSLQLDVVLLIHHSTNENWLHAVAKARDHARQSLYFLDLTDTIGFNDLLALGLQKHDGPCRGLYVYQRHAPKPVPTWLNAKFWANPERFNVDRW
ncbi:MAG: hypothetical protein HWE20_03130 [Gammaproteobacteria bacterium]|nr:hypothetical protein [Gammaproteobacteria bacterium]